MVVSILKDDVVRRTLSVSAQNQPDEYELTYTVRFSVTAGDKELLPPTDISNVRSFAFAEQLLLAKNHEEMILRQDMAHDLADMVMRRLASLCRLIARSEARPRSQKHSFGGRREYDCAPLAPLASLMIAHWLLPALYSGVALPATVSTHASHP